MMQGTGYTLHWRGMHPPHGAESVPLMSARPVMPGA
jgi:hypothetical protein